MLSTISSPNLRKASPLFLTSTDYTLVIKCIGKLITKLLIVFAKNRLIALQYFFARFAKLDMQKQ